MRPRTKLILLVTGALLLLAAANWRTLLFAYATLWPEKRPALLKDVGWQAPGADKAFRARFARGVPERELLGWLRENGFSILPRQHRASRLVLSIPCNQEIEVSWSADADERIERAEAVVREAGCL